LGRGTPHAKLEKIKELPKVGFKPKEQNGLAISEMAGGGGGFRNYEIGEWGK
jgi:hypothetical protein